MRFSFFSVCVFFMFKLVFSSVYFSNFLVHLTFTFYFFGGIIITYHSDYRLQTTVTLVQLQGQFAHIFKIYLPEIMQHFDRTHRIFS